MNANTEDAEFEEIRKSFLGTVPEVLQGIEKEVLELERSSTKDDFSKHCRSAMSLLHSLKGASGAHEFSVISKNCHFMEDQLVALNSGSDQKSKHFFSAFLKNLDSIKNFSEAYLRTKGDVRDSDYSITAHADLLENSADKKTQVLLIESSNVIVKALSTTLQAQGCKVARCRTNLEGLQRILGGDPFDLVIFSQLQSGIKGTTLAAVIQLEAQVPRPRTLLITSSKIVPNTLEFKPDYTLKKGPELFTEISNVVGEVQKNKQKNAKTT